MQDTFPDAKPWPDSAPPAHHNRPPLEDEVALDFDSAIREKGLDARVAEIIEAAGRAPPITSDKIAGAAGDLLAQAKAAGEAVEAEREVLNRPLLNAQRGLKGKADGLVSPMQIAIAPLRDALDGYMADHIPVHGEMGARVGTHTVWEFKIVAVGKLPASYRTHPTVIEALNKVIRTAIKAGQRDIPGVEMWPTQKATIR